MLVDLVPTGALRGHLDAQLGHLVGEFHGDGLAHRVGRGIVQVERRLHALASSHPVRAEHPAGLVEQLARAVDIGFAAHIVRRPRHVVGHAVGHLAVAVEHVVDELLAVHPVVDGAAHSHVLRDRIAGGVGGARLHLGAARRDGGKRYAAGIDRSAIQQVVAARLLSGEGRRRVGNVHLARLRGGQAGILLHEHDHHALDSGRGAVVVGVRAQDDLLTAIPLLKQVAAASHRVAAVVVAMPAIRHDADDRQRVQQRVEGFFQLDAARLVVDGDGAAHVRQVALTRLADFDAVYGVGHIAGGKGGAVGETRVGADGECPGQAIITAGIRRCQVVLEPHVGGGAQERGLDKRLMHMFAATPADERVEARGRFAGDGHAHDDLRGALPGSARCGARLSGGAARTRRKHRSQSHGRGADSRRLHERTARDILHLLPHPSCGVTIQ